MRTLICKACNKVKPCNPRLKEPQEYCGDVPCQRVRKRVWQREKLHSDAAYRARQRACQKKWRKNYPADRYQHDYRLKHPDYALRNRQQQSERNHKRHTEAIVKMDALSQIQSDTYIMRPFVSGKIVKMDAFLVELTVLNQLGEPVISIPP